ncbi:hypothetical protein SELMODRAFT_445503 [Selaginella moellendorffii]|uniref:Uncharacterized protein n=1 Tax=Selaginella moellendorffii TaxID=88036 RepID=D8SJ48_SELML|nr:hypothetical protein SELMODRAFT_445503 [Selaginella moellendorffii]
MAAIYFQEQQLVLKRRWLGRNWPETTLRVMDKCAFVDDEKCIAESFLRRDDSSDGYSLIHNVVETALDHLKEGDDDSENALDVNNLDGLSNLEILEGLPTLIRTLRFSEVSALFSTLTQDTKKRKYRAWLERSILQKIGLRLGESGEQGLENVVKFLRGLKGSRGKRKRIRYDTEKLPGSTAMELPRFPEGCSRIEAAKLILSTLQDLPHRCLRAMADLLSEQPYEQQQLYVVKIGGTRAKLVARVTRLCENFLEEATRGGSDGLPQPLQRALWVISLHAREVQGHDNQLVLKLDALHPDTELLQTKLLSAIAQLHALPFEELEAVYETLTQTKKNTMKHPGVYVESIKNILREALYRCTRQTVPESVQEAVDMVVAARPRSLKFSSVADTRNPKRKEAEVEAVLNLSSELAQVSWEWIETQMSAKQADADDADDDDFDTFDYSLCSSQLKIEENPEEKGKINFEDDEQVDSVDKDVTGVADETAALAYVLIGRAMKEKLAGALGPRATKYLRSGGEVFGDVEPEPTTYGGHESEADMVLSIVKELPSLPESVVHNIEVRLKELKQQKNLRTTRGETSCTAFVRCNLELPARFDFVEPGQLPQGFTGRLKVDKTYRENRGARKLKFPDL